ncbi:MAG: hypothetical protein AAFZ15_33925 [Bacteroidota bacterium]
MKKQKQLKEVKITNPSRPTKVLRKPLFGKLFVDKVDGRFIITLIRWFGRVTKIYLSNEDRMETDSY